MKISRSLLVSSLMVMGFYALPCVVSASNIQQSSSPSVEQLQLAYVATGGTVRNYGGTRLRYYPNHVIVADSYNKEAIRNIAALSRELGWDIVYVQVPVKYREYSNEYFLNQGLRVNYFSSDLNPDTTLNLFYGAAGYYGNHGYYWNRGNLHGNHHGNHHVNHHGAHHGGGHHGGAHHSGGHHGGGHRGGGHRGGGHHGGGHHR